VDQIIGGRVGTITKTQTAFVRALTLRNYIGGEAILTSESLSWLIDAFAAKPTQIRALFLTLLVPDDASSPALRDEIRSLLSGTPGEAFIQE